MTTNGKNIKPQKKNNYFADDSFYSEISGITTSKLDGKHTTTQQSSLETKKKNRQERREMTFKLSRRGKNGNRTKYLDSQKAKTVFKKSKNFISEKTQSNKEEKPASKISEKIKNVDALDGLRALAIFSVMFYHLGFGWAQGGLLGVTVFFVLSGYLITGIISSEIKFTGKIDLKRFWIRRVRRLLPAIIVVIFAVMLLCILFNHVLLTKMKPDVIPSLLWFQNWWYIIRDLSYFESLGAPSPLVHFWSLAIEEQFYIFWPLILLGLHQLKANSKTVRRTCLLLAGISVLLMLLMYNPEADPTRVYYGTDTRAFSLLLGAWLSFVFPLRRQAAKFSSGQPAKPQVSPATTPSAKQSPGALLKTLLVSRQQFVANAVGVVSLVALLLFMIFVDGTSEAMFRYVLLLASICTLGLIFAAATPGTVIAKIFSYQPLVWLGKRSYGMYLWHLPLILLLAGIFDCPTTAPWFAVLVIALTILIAAAQYKFVEDPIRRGVLGQKFGNLKSEMARNSNEPFYQRLSIQSKKLLLAGLIVVASIICISVAAINTPDEHLIPMEEIQSSGNTANEAMYVEGQYYPVLVGDSVTGNLNLNQAFSQGLNDSVVNRKLSQAIDVVKAYQGQGVISNVLIVSCFSNSELRPGDLDSLYGIINPDQELFLVTPYTPYPSAAANAAQIKDFAKNHENVHVIEWDQIAAENKGTYLYKDETHLTPEGQAAYLKMLIEAVNDYLPENVRYNPPAEEIHAEATGSADAGGDAGGQT